MNLYRKRFQDYNTETDGERSRDLPRIENDGAPTHFVTIVAVVVVGAVFLLVKL